MSATSVVVNDLHIPYQDKRCLKLVNGFIGDLKPHNIIINGDLIDFAPVGPFIKRPMMPKDIDQDIKTARNLWDHWKEISPDSNIVWIGGNHEDWVRKFIWKNSLDLAPLGKRLGLALDYLSIPELFGLADFDIEWIPYAKGISLGKLYVTHGQYTGIYACKKHLDVYKRSNLHGHTHGLQSWYGSRMGRNALPEPLGAFSNGCLCTMNPDYILGYPLNWTHGFSVVIHDSQGMFSVQQIPIINRKFFFYGGERVSL